jgi:ubiquitin
MKTFNVEITIANFGRAPTKRSFEVSSKNGFDAIVTALRNVGEVQRACVICKPVLAK